MADLLEGLGLEEEVSPVSQSSDFVPCIQEALARFKGNANVLGDAKDAFKRCCQYNAFVTLTLVQSCNNLRMHQNELVYEAVRAMRKKTSDFNPVNARWRNEILSIHNVVRATIVGQCEAGTTMFSRPVDELIVRLIGKHFETGVNAKQIVHILTFLVS